MPPEHQEDLEFRELLEHQERLEQQVAQEIQVRLEQWDQQDPLVQQVWLVQMEHLE